MYFNRLAGLAGGWIGGMTGGLIGGLSGEQECYLR